MDTVNFQSLNLVRDELVATIEEAARHLEKFVSSQDDSDSLQACIDCVSQIVGTLKVIEFRGAELLASELLAAAKEISPGNSGPKFERCLEVVSATFFVLSRYLEYVQQVERKVPVLLIPQINDLRKLRGETTFPESHFFQVDLSKHPQLPQIESLTLANDEFTSAVRRIRHMYQIGLLGLIKEQQINNSVAMMRRGLIRIRRISGNEKALALLWWLADITLEMFSTQEMQIIETRKMLFGRIDRILKQVEQSGPEAFNAEPPKGLIKELVYLIALSTEESDQVKHTRSVYGLDRFSYTDRDLAGERDLLNGPSAHTVSSLAQVLTAELTNTKKVLEGASQASIQRIDDIEGFVGTLQKVSEILSIVGLVSASNTLKSEIERISDWRGQEEIDPSEMDEVANTLLYLESTVSSIETTKLSDEKLEKANKVAQQEVIASGELSDAKRIVLAESEAGLSLTKRALSSFSDSDFDTGHIRNIGKTLTTVRGGMLMLGSDRAAAILERCAAFVEQVLMDQDPQPGLKEMLETFADSIISVEYYLNSATSSLQMDESVLKLAEESLEALGYGVEADEES
ncbi:MAG: CDP-diacylglycerol--glycerol-3-phosphate 3-phosphatidyltransferase [Agarilytica sp.]